MSKFANRVQMKRKARARRADAAHGQLMAIYGRATQGDSEGYLVVNQASEPDRVARIVEQAEARRERRGRKERTLRPRSQGIAATQSAKPAQYQQLRNGQIVGYPRLMREVKREARQARLQRRANFRIVKRFAAITQAVLN